MSFFTLGSQERASESLPLVPSQRPPLEEGESQSTPVVRRGFTVTNLLLSSDPSEERDYVAVLHLERSDGGQFGTRPNSDESPLAFQLKISGKEVPLFSGILNREIQIEEEYIYRPYDREMEKTLTSLREDLREAQEENKLLKRYLMESQRPRRVS